MTRVPKEGLEPSHPKAQEPKSCVSTSSTTPALVDCLARQARSARIALGTRLLRRRSQSKSVFAQSSSARRSARSGFTSSGFACAAIESTDASRALTWESSSRKTLFLRTQPRMQLKRAARALISGLVRSNGRVGPLALAVPGESLWFCGDRVTDASRALVCRRGRWPSRCTGRRRWCLDPSGRRRSQKSSG